MWGMEKVHIIALAPEWSSSYRVIFEFSTILSLLLLYHFFFLNIFSHLNVMMREFNFYVHIYRFLRSPLWLINNGEQDLHTTDVINKKYGCLVSLYRLISNPFLISDTSFNITSAIAYCFHVFFDCIIRL